MPDTPLGEVERFSALEHIMLEHVGDRINVAIPGPMGFITMAIETGPRGQLPSPGAIPVWLLNYRRIIIILDQSPDLQAAKDQDQDNNTPPKDPPGTFFNQG